jgi:hypothetical protein
MSTPRRKDLSASKASAAKGLVVKAVEFLHIGFVDRMGGVLEGPVVFLEDLDTTAQGFVLKLELVALGASLVALGEDGLVLL